MKNKKKLKTAKNGPFRHNFYENMAWCNNFLVCGIDEVGRGCLAGPVVISAVVLRPKTRYKLLKDSKIMTKLQRETAFKWIKKHSHYASAIISPKLIDTLNIYQATRQGMKKAFVALCSKRTFDPQNIRYLLIDSMPLDLDFPFLHDKLACHSFPKGEQLSASIAAASIVAKVTRDALMNKIARYFPAFKFASHKGYATATHQIALRQQGPTIIHRTSFLKKSTWQTDKGTIQQSFLHNLGECINEKTG